MLAETTFTLPLKEKEDPEAPGIDKRRRDMIKPKSTVSTSHSETVND